MTGLKLIFSIAAILACHAAYPQNKSRIVEDFTPTCDSLSVLLSERTGVEGELVLKNIMKRKGNLDFYFTVSLSDFPWREAGRGQQDFARPDGTVMDLYAGRPFFA